MSCRVAGTAYLWLFDICVEIFLCTPWFFAKYLGSMLVGYLGIGVLCVGIVGCLMPVLSGVVVHGCVVLGLG